MEPKGNSHHCDYLRLHITPDKNEPAELVHINEQITSLDSHILQLNELRRALHRRSCQLRNARSLAYTLPAEVLSYIFQFTIDPGTDTLLADFKTYSTCLRSALTLSSVSTQFRQVALDTPELWKRIPLKIFKIKNIDKFVSLLRHCTTLSPYVGVSVWEALHEADIPSVVETLLSSDIANKIRAFELNHFEDTANVWIKKLQLFCPMLDTFSIKHDTPAFKGADDEGCLCFDLSALHSLTRVVVKGAYLALPIVLPPSVQVLHLYNVPKAVQLSLIYQCPNLMECLAHNDQDVYTDIATPSPFHRPLTLNHLERLTWAINRGLDTIQSVQNLQLASLAFLHIQHYQQENLDGVRLLFYNVSATLTTLVIHTFSTAWGYHDLRQLFRISFPRLESLGISSTNEEPFLNVIHALTPNNDGCGHLSPQYSPVLTFLILRCNSRIEPRCLLDLLMRWRIGEKSCFHVKVDAGQVVDKDWSPQLREELKSIVGDRQLEVTWNNKKLYAESTLVRGNDLGNS